MNNENNSNLKNYQLGVTLGRGASSIVCKAKNLINGQTFACKIFPKTNLTDKGDLERFQREINVMAFIHHENLVCLYDFFWDSQNFYLIIDYCPGGELFDYLVENGKVDEDQSSFIFKQIVLALKICHESGISHRDLKPENILITQFPFIKLSDFGLCSYNSENIQNQTFCGSPCYCSPECLCRIPYDCRVSDVWSLGIILYALVVGDLPWNTTNSSMMIHQIVKGNFSLPSFLSENVKSLIKGMLKVNPNERLTLLEVLEHPWVQISDHSKFSKDKPENLQTFRALSLKQLAIESEKVSQTIENGIISPFEENEEKSISSALPQLTIKQSQINRISSNSAPKLPSSSTWPKKYGQRRIHFGTVSNLIKKHSKIKLESLNDINVK